MNLKKYAVIMLILLLATTLIVPVVMASPDPASPPPTASDVVTPDDSSSAADTTINAKAFASAIAIAVAAAGGAISMGIATVGAVNGIARQPEADGKIRTTLMLSLVFIETAIIYALLVVILIIFVL